MPILDPDWIPPIEMTFDVEKPIRSEQGLQLAGNPIAMAQGKAGAPKVMGRAMKVFSDWVTPSPATDWATFTGLAGLHFVQVKSYATSTGAGAVTFLVSMSQNNGSTWASSTGVGNFSLDSTSASVNILFDLVTGRVLADGGATESGTGLQFKTFGAGTYNAVRVQASIGGTASTQYIMQTMQGLEL